MFTGQEHAFYFPLLYCYFFYFLQPLAMKQVQYELKMTEGDNFVYVLLFVYFVKHIHELLCILYTV